MGRSVLARSDDDGRTFRALHDISTTKFINVAPRPVPALGELGLPGDGPGVLFWASGRYRQSNPYFAFAPAGDIEKPNAMRYFAGLDGAGMPVWSGREADAAPLFEQPCLGELSVTWNAPLRKWLMLYNCAVPENKIFVRAADRPWGPWSEPEILFDPEPDGGTCRFMNAPGRRCPSVVTDPHSPDVAGDVYGPYVIDRFTTGEDGASSTIHFAMSTWNPYTVVLMRATLRVRDGQVAASP